MNVSEIPFGLSDRMLDNRRVRAGRRGAIIPLVAVSMVAMLGLLALAMDSGILQRQRSTTQKAADAGAIAGAIEIYRGRQDSVVASAKSETGRNGSRDGVNGVVVNVTYPTTSGNFVGSNYVRVVVQRTVATLFGGVIGQPTATVRAESVAGLAASHNCLVLLDPSSSSALSVTSGASLSANGCGVQVNSNSGKAVDVSGNSSLTAGAVGITGGMSGVSQPAANTGIPPAADPLAYLAMPPVPDTCAYGAMTIKSAQTLAPGTYCGDIDVQTPAGVATLSEGVYFMRGASISVGANSTLRSSGTGVTIIMTSGPAGTFGTLNFQSNSTIILSAATNVATPLPGVLFYQDPAAPNATNIFHAGAGSVLNGTLYFPTQDIEVKSGANTVINGALVARGVDVKNSTDLVINGISGGSQYFVLKRASLVQ